MGDAHVAGRLTVGGENAPVLVLLEAPGALGKAGRLLSELPRAMVRFGEQRMDGMHPSIAVAVVEGPAEIFFAGSRVTGPTVSEAVRLVRHPGMLDRRRRPSGSLVLALAHPLYEDLDQLLGPAALVSLERVGSGEEEGWVYTGDPAELGHTLVEAEEARGAGIGWPVCGLGSSDADPAGCPGIRIAGHGRCLAHLEREEQRAYLGTLGPGSPVDLRGTTFEGGLLQEVLEAVRDPGSQRVTLGEADFDRARFVDDWNTVDADFSARASFSRAVFAGRATFVATTVAGWASFAGAVFQGVAVFDRSRFHRAAAFRRTVFRGPAEFTETVFLDGVSFGRAMLEASADLNGMRVTGATDFSRTLFGGPAGLSGAVFTGSVSFTSATWERGLVSSGAVFDGPADFARATFRGRVRFEGVRFTAHEDAAPPFTDRPEVWAVHRRREGTWDIRPAGTGEE